MKVSECEKCKHCKTGKWSTYYKPNGYHAIGISHRYRYCSLHEKRCLDVKKCNERNTDVNVSVD